MSELVLIDTSVWVLALRAGGPVVVRQEDMICGERDSQAYSRYYDRSVALEYERRPFRANSQAQPLADEELNVASRSHAQRE
jgi:hypothetical protein